MIKSNIWVRNYEPAIFENYGHILFNIILFVPKKNLTCTKLLHIFAYDCETILPRHIWIT